MKNRVWAALGFVLFTLAFLVLISLGFWQLGRADEKQTVLDQIASAEHGGSADYSELRAFPAANVARLNYQRRQLVGHWQVDQQFLLANRMHQGVLGEEVLTPFRLDSGDWVLVNRGWQKKGESPPVLGENQAVQGVLYLPGSAYQLGEAILNTDEISPWRETLYLDIAAISKALGQTLAPAVLVMEPAPESGLIRVWQPVNMPPAKHLAYAVQWFGLALALVVFGVVWLRRMRKVPNE